MNLFLIDQILYMDLPIEVKERALAFIKNYNNILLIDPKNISLSYTQNGVQIKFFKENELLSLFFDENIKNDGWSYFKYKKNFNDNLINIFNVLDNIDSLAEFYRYCEQFYENK